MGRQGVNTSFSSKIRHVSPYLASHVAPKSRKLKGPQIMSWWSKRWSIDSSLSLHIHPRFARAMNLLIRLFLIRLLIVKNLIQRSCPHKESYYLGQSTVLRTYFQGQLLLLASLKMHNTHEHWTWPLLLRLHFIQSAPLEKGRSEYNESKREFILLNSQSWKLQVFLKFQ